MSRVDCNIISILCEKWKCLRSNLPNYIRITFLEEWRNSISGPTEHPWRGVWRVLPLGEICKDWHRLIMWSSELTELQSQLSIFIIFHLQVDNLLWDSEEGEGRQFRRGFSLFPKVQKSYFRVFFSLFPKGTLWASLTQRSAPHTHLYSDPTWVLKAHPISQKNSKVPF